jgi:hypothetical protein
MLYGEKHIRLGMRERGVADGFCRDKAQWIKSWGYLLTNVKQCCALVFESQGGGMVEGIAESQPIGTAVHITPTWSPYKLWRPTSIFNLWIK